MKPALFLDRDGTLIEDPGYLRDPAQVRLLPGVASALGKAQAAGYRLVVVTNQSGIGRGLISPAEVTAIHAEIDHLLASEGVRVDQWEYCPHLPSEGCECRKPGIGMHRAAARELDLDLSRSWCIGDRLSDLLPAERLGCRAILVRSGEGEAHRQAAEARGIVVVPDLAAAVVAILAAAE